MKRSVDQLLAVGALCLVIGLISVLLILLCSCSRTETPNAFTPAPRATAPQASVEADARLWASVNPANRFWATVTPTGSMEPFINEHSIVLCQRYKGEILPKGSVIVFDRGDTHNVLHVLVDENQDSVYVSGYNNHNSDGWFPKTTIKGFLVGQLYCQ